VVEDDQYNTQYLFEILSTAGFMLLHAKLGKEAVQIALNQHIDLILMDIRLPDIDGYQATQLIKKQKPDLIIIAQTAYASTSDKEKTLAAGCNEYISKPIKRELLLSLIDNQLNSHQYE
jgi:hypothetical protein